MRVDFNSSGDVSLFLQNRFKSIVDAFKMGCGLALTSATQDELFGELSKIPLDLRGFGFEGSAMAFGLMDQLSFRPHHFHDFVSRFGDSYAYVMHVGLGWAFARVPWRLERLFRDADQLLKWLIIDGFGFHEGFFRRAKHKPGATHPKKMIGYEKRAFDQGFGRSLWFIEGASVSRIHTAISRYSESRRADLWSGVGLAAVYAGEVGDSELRLLAESAGEFFPHLAQGAAFAAKARHRAGNPTPYTDRACRQLFGASSADAAATTDSALEPIPVSGGEPAYEIWRQRIQKNFSNGKVKP